VTEPNTEWVWLARIRRPQGRKGEVLCDLLTDFPEKFAERKHLWLIGPDAKGHDFSRAETSPKDSGAGAPITPTIRGGMDGTATPPSGRRNSNAPEAQRYTPEAQRYAPEAQRSLAPRFNVGYANPNMIPESRRDGAKTSPPQESTAPAPRPIELANHWLHKGAIVLHFAGVDSITQAEELAGLIVAIPRSQRAALAEDEIHIADLIGCELIDVARQPAATIGRIENVDRSAGPVPLLIVTGAKGEVLVPFAKAYLRAIDLENKRIEMALPEGLTDL
jgi:16S rRNA processing protein RimM